MSTPMEQLRNTFLSDIADHVAALLRDYNIADDVADQVGDAVADYIADDYGGQVVSFPKDQRYRLAKRDQAIVGAHHGNNLADLSRRFGLTQRAIRNILKRADHLAQSADQGNLFNTDPETST